MVACGVADPDGLPGSVVTDSDYPDLDYLSFVTLLADGVTAQGAWAKAGTLRGHVRLPAGLRRLPRGFQTTRRDAANFQAARCAAMLAGFRGQREDGRRLGEFSVERLPSPLARQSE
jgi:hypothetical protein